MAQAVWQAANDASDRLHFPAGADAVALAAERSTPFPEREAVQFGHPSGTLRVGAQAKLVDGQWTVTKAIMSRRARALMEGAVRVPGDSF